MARVINFIVYDNYHQPNKICQFEYDRVINIAVIYYINTPRTPESMKYKICRLNLRVFKSVWHRKLIEVTC